MIRTLCTFQLQGVSKNVVEHYALVDTGLNRLGIVKRAGFSDVEMETFTCQSFAGDKVWRFLIDS